MVATCDYEVTIDWLHGLSSDMVIAGTDLKAWWRFQDGTGTTLTDEQGTHDGTITDSTWVVHGHKPTFALQFANASAPGVTISAHADLRPTDAVSIAMWVFPTKATTTSRPWACNGNHVFRWVGGKFGWGVHVDGAWREYDEASTVDLNKHYLIVGTYDSTSRDVRLYRNVSDTMTLTKETELSGLGGYTITGTSSAAYIGNWTAGNTTYGFDGVVSEVWFWKSHEATLVEIQELYDLTKPITGDCRTVHYMRGRDEELGSADTGKMEIDLVDTTGKYVIENPDSPLYGYLLSGRPIRLRGFFNADPAGFPYTFPFAFEYDDTVFNLYHGVIDDIDAEPNPRVIEAYLTSVDGLDMLSRNKCTIGMETNEEADYMIGEALDDVDWSSVKRDMAAGLDTYPLIFADRQAALSFIQKVEQSEFAFCYVDKRGYFVYENRYTRSTYHDTTEWMDGGYEGQMDEDDYMNLVPRGGLNWIRNRIVMKTTLREKAASLSDLWVLQENETAGNSPAIAAGASKTFWANFSNVADDLTDTGANPTTHYKGNANADGSGADRTSDVSVVQTDFAKSAKLVVSNTGGTSLYLTHLKVEGKIYTDHAVHRLVEDTDSQAKYGVRELEVDIPYHTTTDMLTDLGEYVLTAHSVISPGYDVTVQNKTEDNLWNILNLSISNAVNLVNTALGIDDTLNIDAEEHTIELAGNYHQVVWRLTKSSTSSSWTLGTSTLGTDTYLGF